jgi:hypothetical protein
MSASSAPRTLLVGKYQGTTGAHPHGTAKSSVRCVLAASAESCTAYVRTVFPRIAVSFSPTLASLHTHTHTHTHTPKLTPTHTHTHTHTHTRTHARTHAHTPTHTRPPHAPRSFMFNSLSALLRGRCMQRESQATESANQRAKCRRLGMWTRGARSDSSKCQWTTSVTELLKCQWMASVKVHLGLQVSQPSTTMPAVPAFVDPASSPLSPMSHPSCRACLLQPCLLLSSWECNCRSRSGSDCHARECALCDHVRSQLLEVTRAQVCNSCSSASRVVCALAAHTHAFTLNTSWTDGLRPRRSYRARLPRVKSHHRLSR